MATIGPVLITGARIFGHFLPPSQINSPLRHFKISKTYFLTWIWHQTQIHGYRRYRIVRFANFSNCKQAEIFSSEFLSSLQAKISSFFPGEISKPKIPCQNFAKNCLELEPLTEHHQTSKTPQENSILVSQTKVVIHSAVL